MLIRILAKQRYPVQPIYQDVGKDIARYSENALKRSKGGHGGSCLPAYTEPTNARSGRFGMVSRIKTRETKSQLMIY